ncbi:MAG TPA: PIN domain-containing protein [Gemmatimonadales bacterium]|nr:PIN domain-containing protein [Gemmatimonadales bacterium]
MILADTSVWIDHFRRGNAVLRERLESDTITTHAFVRGELALGQFKRREEIFLHFDRLPQIPVASHDEVLTFVEHHKIYGEGMGWVDAHLLAAALLSEVSVWTLDTALERAARTLGINVDGRRRS